MEAGWPRPRSINFDILKETEKKNMENKNTTAENDFSEITEIPNSVNGVSAVNSVNEGTHALAVLQRTIISKHYFNG